MHATVHIPRGQISFSKLLWSSSVPIPSITLLFTMIDDHWSTHSRGQCHSALPYKCMQNCQCIHSTQAHQEVQIFPPNFFGTLCIHISSIFLLFVIIGSLDEVFQSGSFTCKMHVITQNNKLRWICTVLDKIFYQHILTYKYTYEYTFWWYLVLGWFDRLVR
jgi:hypothetical protein